MMGRRRVVRPDQGYSASFTYTVAKGDNLSAIARRFGHPGGWQALYQLNRARLGANPNLIYPGQRLVVVRTR